MENQKTMVPSLDTKDVVFDVLGQKVTLNGKIVRQFLTKGNGNVTDQEIVQFISLCKYQQLNPFLNEAYLVKFKNNQGGEDNAQVITSESAYLKRAEACEHYQGFRAGLILKRGSEVVYEEGEFMFDTDVLLGGWCEVYRDDRKYPTVGRVSLKDYDKGRNTWKQIRCTMIRKVAIVHALREAFQTQLGALYTNTEMPQVEDVNYEEVNNKNIQENANKTPLPATPVDQPAATDPAPQEVPAAQEEQHPAPTDLFNED